MNLAIALLLTVATTTTTPPEAAKKTPPPAAVEKVAVFLQTDARDVVGATYVARLRRAFDASNTFESVTSPASARFIVGIVTMDPKEADGEGAGGRATVAAVTLQLGNATGLNGFVYSWVLVAREDSVDSLVGELLAAIDKEIQELGILPLSD